MGDTPAGDTHGAEFGAPVKRGDGTPRVQQTCPIECGLDRVEAGEFGGRELHAHLVQLLHPDTMLTSDRPPHLHAEPQDLRADVLGKGELRVVIGIESDERMQVAITGVKHIGDDEPAFR